MRGAPTSTSVPSSLSLAAVLIAVGGCAAGSEHHDPVLDGGPADAAPSADVASADAGTNDATAAADGPSLVGDGTTLDVACHHLNIGILGNPGQNPSSNFDAWLTSAGTSVQRIQTTAPTPAITSATLQPFDVVILDAAPRDYGGRGERAVRVRVGRRRRDRHVRVRQQHRRRLARELAPRTARGRVHRSADRHDEQPRHGFHAAPHHGGHHERHVLRRLRRGRPRRPRRSYTARLLARRRGRRPGPARLLRDPARVGPRLRLPQGDEWISFDSEWSTLPEIKQLWVQIFAWVAPASGCALQPSQ